MTDPQFQIDRPDTKTVTREIEPGKFRIGFDPNYRVENLRLIDIRKRKWPLIQLSREELYSRCTKDAEGKVIESSILRGLPACFAPEGANALLWPLPAHSWTVEADLIRRTK